MKTEVIVSVVAAASSLGAAYMAYRASTGANRISEKKIDAEAYERAIAFYDKQLAEMDRQLDRMRLQVEKLNDALAAEQDVSNGLRNLVRTLQAQVQLLESTMADFRERQNRRIPPTPAA